MTRLFRPRSADSPPPAQPSLHAGALHSQLVLHRDRLLLHWTRHPIDSLDEYATFLETQRRRPESLIFAVFDQSVVLDKPVAPGGQDETRLERLAGMAGVKCDAAHRKAELA